ncbi:hypothetical protein GCK32_022111 [Trichostrongylus colubriformis]|uniref:Uncharacterized protein n=1 Tax=Trichostrongylus colubriformis TaxID=6319 RepID=A0AAN8IGI2_TRICO
MDVATTRRESASGDDFCTGFQSSLRFEAERRVLWKLFLSRGYYDKIPPPQTNVRKMTGCSRHGAHYSRRQGCLFEDPIRSAQCLIPSVLVHT